MFQSLIVSVITSLFKLIKPDMLKDFIDAGMDRIEDKYIQGLADTPQEIAIRKAIDLVRSVLNIEDANFGTDKK